MPQPKLRALAPLSSQPLLPICSHSQLCPEEQRSCGGTRQGGAGVSSKKPKPGAVPALCDNQAQSKVSNGQKKWPQDSQDLRLSSPSHQWSEHGRALLQQPQLFNHGEKPGSAPCTGNIALLNFWITLQLILAWQQADPTPLG